MSDETRRKQLTLRRLIVAGWKDGWWAAWLVVTGFNLAMGMFGTTPEWVQGAFFGGSIGMVGGYMVTQQRNYRRVKREDIEFQLDRLKDLELRTIARGGGTVHDRETVLGHIHYGQRELRRSLERLS